MVDLSVFADEKFDAKVWVNAACRGRVPDDPIDRYLTDLEMKLQLMAETIAGELEEQSTGALLRMPRASRDVLRVRDDAINLRSTVSAILSKLKQAEGTSAESVAALARVDVVKQRMEAAHETLQDAAGLAKLSASVEEVFASGDLPRAAETLANMRRCLAVVGEVPEFTNVKRQLEVLEDRLEAMVQPRISDALSHRKVDSTQGLRDILITIGRYSSLEQHYTRVRMRPLRRLWEEFESGKGGLVIGKSSAGDRQTGDRRPASINVSNNVSVSSFADWLPKFYDEVLLIMEEELKWCTVAFPEDFMLLVPKLLIETMIAISASFAARIEAACEEATARGTSAPDGASDDKRHSRLGILISLHGMTVEFGKSIQHLLSGVEATEVARVLRAVYSPYEASKGRYGELEQAQLLAEIAALSLKGATVRGVGARGVELSETVGRMDDSIPQLLVFLEAAVDRCLSFTGGSEAEALLHTLDEVMLHYLATLLEILKSLRPVCGVDPQPTDGAGPTTQKDTGSDNTSSSAVEMIPEEDEWPIVQGALQFLTVADVLAARSSVFEASLRTMLNRLSTRLQLPSTLISSAQAGAFGFVNGVEIGGGQGLIDMAVLRLTDAPEKGRKLLNLLEQAKDPRFHALPKTSQRVSAFTEAVNELVYEVLISKVRSKLSDLSTMSIWGAEEEDNAFHLPNFSAYPLPYVTSIGEYLFTLPQQLEPLASGSATSGGGIISESLDENADEAQYLATEWMFKVAEGATALYVEQIRGIQLLSERGAQQLSADIEYLCNVLSALSMTTPPVLSTYQVCVAATRDKLPQMAKQDGLDLQSVRLICKMRQVSLD